MKLDINDAIYKTRDINKSDNITNYGQNLMSSVSRFGPLL